MRSDGRKNNQLRSVNFTRNYLKFPEGSVLAEMGETTVLCTASVQEGVPSFLEGTGQGWVTAEYSMLPRSTETRTGRDRVRSAGRTQEIQRLIGRSLRSVVDLNSLGKRTIQIDCDVLQADGGTRTASVTGSYLALLDAFFYLKQERKLEILPVNGFLAAVSSGVVNGEVMLDLNFQEDFAASVDLNVVMTDEGELIEIQGTAEGKPFGRDSLDEMLDLSQKGINELILMQKEAIKDKL